jgi:hypothetical protein
MWQQTLCSFNSNISDNVFGRELRDISNIEASLESTSTHCATGATHLLLVKNKTSQNPLHPAHSSPHLVSVRSQLDITYAILKLCLTLELFGSSRDGLPRESLVS